MRLGQALHPMRGVLNELFQSIHKVREVDLTGLQAAVQEDFVALAIDRQHRTARAAPEQVGLEQLLKQGLVSFGPNDAHGAVQEYDAALVYRCLDVNGQMAVEQELAGSTLVQLKIGQAHPCAEC